VLFILILLNKQKLFIRVNNTFGIYVILVKRRRAREVGLVMCKERALALYPFFNIYKLSANF
jgi:hypothetical protein